MKITFDGKSGTGFRSQGEAEMHVRTLIDRIKSEFGMGDVGGDERLAYPQDETDKRYRVKGSLAFD